MAFHLPSALPGNNQPNQRFLLFFGFFFSSEAEADMKQIWHFLLQIGFWNWLHLSISSSIAVPSQFCDYNKQFAYKAPNLQAVTTLGFCDWGRGCLFVFLLVIKEYVVVGWMEMIFPKQGGVKKMEEQINNKEHIYQCFISYFKGDTAKFEVMQNEAFWTSLASPTSYL